MKLDTDYHGNRMGLCIQIDMYNHDGVDDKDEWEVLRIYEKFLEDNEELKSLKEKYGEDICLDRRFSWIKHYVYNKNPETLDILDKCYRNAVREYRKTLEPIEQKKTEFLLDKDDITEISIHIQ